MPSLKMMVLTYICFTFVFILLLCLGVAVVKVL